MKLNFTNIIIIIFLIAAGLFASNYLALASSGFTVLSITTSPSIITESTNLRSANWIIETSFNGGGEYIVGTITPDQTKQKSSYESLYPLEIRTTAMDESFIYPIKNTGRGIYKYSSSVVSPGQCGAADWTIFWWEKDWLGVPKHKNDICVYKTIDAVEGDLDNPTNKLTATISMTADGYTVSKTIDTLTQSNVDFTDRNGQWISSANWYGNLLSGNSPPNSALYVATYIKGDSWGLWKNTWTVSNRNEYTAYLDTEYSVENALDDYVVGSISCTSLDACKGIVDAQISKVNAARATLIGGSDVNIGSAQTVINRNDPNNGKVQITLDRSVSYPQVRFMVRADWIGIRMPVGMPSIQSVSCPTFASGDATGLCDITVKNTGDGAGTFYPTFPDCGIFTQAYVSQQYTLGPGETQTMRVYINHGTAGQDTVSTCTVKVTDTHDSTRYDTASVTVHMTEPIACVPGSIRVSGKNVYKCNDAGTGELEPLTCGVDETLQNDPDLDNGWGGWYCKKVPASGGSPGFLDGLLGWLSDGGLNNIFMWILFIVVILIVLYLLALILPILLPLLLNKMLRK